MTKPGRPRKKGKRYKNGRLTRAANQEDAMETVTEARMRHYAVGRATARQPDIGFPLGRLRRRGYISQVQYEAGVKFAEAMSAYLKSKLGASGTAPAQDMDRRGASLTEGSVQREDEARAYIDALAEIDRTNACSRSATSILWDVCLTEYSGHMDENEIGQMREGLNAIARAIDRRQRLARKAA